MALSDIPGMPKWPEFASKIAHDYLDCGRRAAAAEMAGNKKEATAFRKLASRYKRMMDKNGITIRA